MFDIVTEAKLFNEYITPGVIAQLQAQSKLWDRIKKSDKLELDGKVAKQKVRIANSQSARASNSSTYPTAAETTPEETLVYLKRAMMLSMQFDGFALESASKKGTQMDPESFEKEGLIETVVDDLSRQLMLDGSGHLCQANGLGSSSTTLTVNSPYYANATKFLKPGRVIDSYLSTSIEINSDKIVTVDSTTQVTLTTNASWTDDSWILNEDVYGTASEVAGKGEMMGLLGIVSASDPPTPNNTLGLQGLLVASYPDWKAISKTNGGVNRPLTEDLITSAIDDTELGEISVMLITQKLRRKWAELLREYKLTDSRTMWGGWSGMPFLYDGREIPMVVDKFVPDNMILGIDESKLTLYVTKKNAEITWEQGRDGSILQKVALKNEYVAEGHIFANLGTSVRKCHFLLDDLTEPA
jgi:hypothetical protein